MEARRGVYLKLFWAFPISLTAYALFSAPGNRCLEMSAPEAVRDRTGELLVELSRGLPWVPNMHQNEFVGTTTLPLGVLQCRSGRLPNRRELTP